MNTPNNHWRTDDDTRPSADIRKPVATNTHGAIISVIDATTWEDRLIAEVKVLRESCKDAIILYDYRTNTVRVFDGRAKVSLRLD